MPIGTVQKDGFRSVDRKTDLYSFIFTVLYNIMLTRSTHMYILQAY
eukprot:SAG31_NODE_32220_length_358_cov_1.177606_1_plen_45_part_01